MKRAIEKIDIKYIKSVKDDNGDKIPIYDWVSAETACTRRYNAAMCLMMGVTGCAAHLMEWISGNMTEGNYVHNNSVTRTCFREFHKKHKGKLKKTYGDDAVNKAFKQLCDAGFLVSVNKGTYRVDPLLYFSDDDSNRIKLIKVVMEFKANEATKLERTVK